MKSFLIILSFAGMLAVGSCSVSKSADASYGRLEKSKMQEGPINDMALLYNGGLHRKVSWNEAQLQANVSYVDQKGKEHWLIDTFLFLEIINGDGHFYDSGFDHGGKNPDGTGANKADWTRVIDQYFAPNGPVCRLNEVIKTTAARIGNPKYKRRLVIFVPTPFFNQSNWGELNGKNLDFSNQQDRIAATKWYLAYVEAKIKSLRLDYLSFDGYYYVSEQLTNNREYLPTIASIVREKGHRFYWIPYWGCDGMGEWKSMGFDEAFLQPNYFFPTQKPDYKKRFDDVMNFAQDKGMSLEMEFDERALFGRGKDYRGERLMEYIKAFSDYDVARKNHVAYYQGDCMFYDLKSSKHPEDQDLYHSICGMVLKRQQARGEK